MTDVRRDRNIKVPTRGTKNERGTGADHRPSRPAEGRKEVPRPQAKKPQSQPRQSNNRQRDGQRQNATVKVVVKAVVRVGNAAVGHNRSRP